MSSPHSRQRPSNPAGWTGMLALAWRTPSSTRELESVSASSSIFSSMVFHNLSDQVVREYRCSHDFIRKGHSSGSIS